jgi:hypothetical protein
MNIYILTPIATGKGTPWHPWYDKTFGVIVSAENEVNARELANEKAGDENGSWISNDLNVWKDEKFTTCKILESNKPEVIMVNHAGA